MVRFNLDRCEEDSNGEWVCIQHTQNPLIWPGDHTIEWMASGCLTHPEDDDFGVRPR